MNHRRFVVHSVLLAFAISTGGTLWGQGSIDAPAAIQRTPAPRAPTPKNASPAGSALVTLFSPSRAPKRKTMGLLQRSFLDLADQGDQALEVAIVVDGTDSMTAELSGIRQSINQMIEDLKRYRNNDVRAAIVVYRDAGSPSREVVIPLESFTDDPETLAKAVETLQPESGAPFFHELPDLGIHEAIDKLPWSEDDQVAKWILMFGDAPPYADAFKDIKNKAYRRFATPFLVGLAKQKNIRINCVLCTSNENVAQPYDSVIAETRTFMQALSGGTDGLMLDMSYPEIRTAMIDAGNQPDIGLAPIQPIAAIDLAAVRRENLPSDQQIKPVRVAVLPHMAIDQMTFDPSNQAVRVSTALRTQLARVSGVTVASPRDVKDQLRRLRAQGLADQQAIRGLSARLGVDYVVWGSVLPDAAVRTAAYRRDTGQQIVPVNLPASDSGEVAYALVRASSASAPNDQALAQLVSRMEAVKSAITKPMSDNAATNNDLLTAIEALDQALAYEAGSDDSVELLEQADRAVMGVIGVEPRSAIAHWLRSNVAYNQAARLFQKGETEAANKRIGDMRSSLRLARAGRSTIASESLRTEIDGDFYLLVEKDPVEAVKRYQQMTAGDQPLATQLRGHWMLSGIHAGDWGMTDTPTVDPDLARQHVIEILANWPSSPEATLLKEWLRWDETTETTDFNYLPQVNTGLVGA